MGAEEICENSENLKENSNAIQSILEDSYNENIHSIPPEKKHQSACPISEITDNLILTSATFVNSLNIEQYRVSCVISCAPELPDPPLLQDHVIYYKIDTIDNGLTNILNYFDSTADLIQQVFNLGGKTLIYCVAGVSRSATICIAYLMKYQKISLLQAYNTVKACRPKIKPNCGFFKQLIDYEKQLFGCTSVEMVFNETVNMEIPDVYDINYRNPFVLNRRKQIHFRN